MISPPAVKPGRGVYFCSDGCHQITQARQAAAPLLESQSPLNKAAASSLRSPPLWLAVSLPGRRPLIGRPLSSGWGCRLPLHETASIRGGTRAAWSGRSPASRTSCNDGTRTATPVGARKHAENSAFMWEAVCLLCVSSLIVRCRRFLATGRMLLLKWNWVNGSLSPSSMDALFDPQFICLSLPLWQSKLRLKTLLRWHFKLAVLGGFTRLFVGCEPRGGRAAASHSQT